MSILLSEGRHAAEFVLTEANGQRSRENVKIANSTACDAGAVLIRTATTNAPVVGTAVFAGTGNGVFTPAAPAYGVNARQGTYKVQLIDEGTNAGDFEVIRPDGTIDGIASVGVAYAGQIAFTIADGSTDFASPAVFTVPVTIASANFLGTYTPLLNNMVPAAGDDLVIALYPKLSIDTDRGISVIARQAEVNGNCLVWPASQAAANKDAAIYALARSGIIVR
jgi:hypothetical protein